MLTETTDYATLCRDFRWDIPARFNIATACCDRHADGTKRLALFADALPMTATGKVLRRELRGLG